MRHGRHKFGASQQATYIRHASQSVNPSPRLFCHPRVSPVSPTRISMPSAQIPSPPTSPPRPLAIPNRRAIHRRSAPSHHPLPLRSALRLSIRPMRSAHTASRRSLCARPLGSAHTRPAQPCLLPKLPQPRMKPRLQHCQNFRIFS